MSDPRRIGDLIEELDRSALPASAASVNGKFPFFVCSTSPLRADTWVSDQDAVLLSTGGEAAVHLGTGRYGYSTDVWAIRSKSAKLDTAFLALVLQHRIGEINRIGF